MQKSHSMSGSFGIPSMEYRCAVLFAGCVAGRCAIHIMGWMGITRARKATEGNCAPIRLRSSSLHHNARFVRVNDVSVH
jgi:hypothetical protein